MAINLELKATIEAHAGVAAAFFTELHIAKGLPLEVARDLTAAYVTQWLRIVFNIPKKDDDQPWT